MGATHYALRLAAIALLAATAAWPCSATTITLSPAADTYVRQIVNANEGTADFLRVNATPNRALVRFDQTPITAAAVGMVLLSASFDLYVESASSWGPGREVDVHRLTASWTEAGATWNCPVDTDTTNNQPDCAVQWNGGAFTASPTGTAVQTDSLSARYVSYDVTADVAAFLSGAPNNGWLLKKRVESDAGVAIYTSREGSAAQRPRLVLNLAVPTATSTRTRTATVTPTVPPGVTVTPAPTDTPETECGPVPLAGCKQPQKEKKSQLLLKSKGEVADRLVWKWSNGAATAAAEFGDPTAFTTYALCVYDETAGAPELKLSALVPPGGAWTATTKGFRYSDPAAASGITSILLKEGADGKAKIIVKGTGANLGLPALPLAQDQHVIVQLLHADDPAGCWEARYSNPAAKNNDRIFKDKGDPPGPPSGPTATLTNTPLGGPGTPTPTATPLPTSGSAVCGNGFLEQGETCGSCPADCTSGACTASATMVTFQVHFEGAIGTSPITATTLLGYRGNRVSIPGSGTATSVRQRVTFPPPLPNSIAINDLDYAIRVVVGRTAGLANGLLYSVTFDQCQGAPVVTAADFGCTVEACAGAGGPIVGCSCTVAGP